MTASLTGCDVGVTEEENGEEEEGEEEKEGGGEGGKEEEGGGKKGEGREGEGGAGPACTTEYVSLEHLAAALPNTNKQIDE